MEKSDILEKFGKLVIEQVYDESLRHFKTIRAGNSKWGGGNGYTNVLNKLSESEKDVMYKLHENTLNTVIFSFLQIFEEHEEFKIIYEEMGQQSNLNKLSEMLKAEHHGWIEKFSRAEL